MQAANSVDLYAHAFVNEWRRSLIVCRAAQIVNAPHYTRFLRVKNYGEKQDHAKIVNAKNVSGGKAKKVELWVGLLEKLGSEWPQLSFSH